MTDGVLDLFINEGFVRMVDDSLVYMRGFGATPTGLDATNPSLRISPQVFQADGTLLPSRSYPLGAALPVEGRMMWRRRARARTRAAPYFSTISQPCISRCSAEQNSVQ